MSKQADVLTHTSIQLQCAVRYLLQDLDLACVAFQLPSSE